MAAAEKVTGERESRTEGTDTIVGGAPGSKDTPTPDGIAAHKYTQVLVMIL